MATFAPISYTYVPTPPRLKGVTARRRIPPKPFSILDKSQRIKPSSVALEKARPSADEQSRVQKTGNIYSDNDKENDDNDDDYYPTVEQILYTRLHKEGFATGDPGLNYTAQGVDEVALEETRGSFDHSRSTSDDSGTSRSNPIVLGENDSDAFETEGDNSSHHGESAQLEVVLPSSAETAVNLTALIYPSHVEGCHNLERRDSTEMAQHLQLAGGEALVSDSMRTSSEPLHDHSGIDDLYAGCARSEATMSHVDRPCSNPPRCSRASPQYQLSQEDRFYTSPSALDENELLRPPLSTDTFNEVNNLQQQPVEEEVDDNDDGEPQQEVESAAVALSALRGADTHLSSKENGSTRPAKRQRPLSSCDLFPEPAQEGRVRRELINTCAKSDEERRRPRPVKRKQLSSYEGTTQKKRRHYLQQRSTRQPKPRSRAQRHCAESALPSPAPSAPLASDTELLSDLSVGGSSRNIRPVLTEITFRPHSLHECSFTAVIRANYGRPELSFGQVAKLIENVGYVRKINDFTIKPLTQNSLLLVGFSRAIGTASKASCMHKDTIDIQLQHNTIALCKGKLLCSKDDDVLSDSNPELSSSDDDGLSTEDEQGYSSTRKHSAWLPLDEQRLLAYKKEGKPWSWIFRKFPGRTPGAVRTRCQIVQARLQERHGNKNDEEGASVAGEPKLKRRRGRPPKKI